MAEAYFLSADDVKLIKELLAEKRSRRGNTEGRPGAQEVDHQEHQAPEVYVSYAPSGVTARSGTTPGTGQVYVYQTNISEPGMATLEDTYLDVTALNLSERAITAGAWLLVTRTKDGQWVCIQSFTAEYGGTDCCPPTRGTQLIEVPCSGSGPQEAPCVYFGNGNASESVSYCPGGPVDIWGPSSCPWWACVWIPCACAGGGIYAPGLVQVTASGTGSFSGLSFTANSTFPAYGSGWPVNYSDQTSGISVIGRIVFCCAVGSWGFVGTVTALTRSDGTLSGTSDDTCVWCTTNFNGCVIGDTAGATRASDIDCDVGYQDFTLDLHTDCGTVTLTVAGVSDEPSDCGIGTADLEMYVPDGTYAGTHTLVWDAGNSWWASSPFQVRNTGGVWEVIDRINPSNPWIQATSQTCIPALAATFPGSVIGAVGDLQLTAA